MLTTRNILIAFGIIAALLIANYLYKKMKVDTAISEQQATHGDTLKSDRSITHLKSDATGVYLEVDGKELHFPLPEGYKILKEEEYPKQHTVASHMSARKNALQFCAFINSDDVQNKIGGKNTVDEARIAILSIDNHFLLRRFSPYDFEQEKVSTKKSYTEDRSDDGVYLCGDDTSFTVVYEKENLLYISTYTLINEIVISTEFYRLLSKKTNKQQLINDATQYTKLLGKQ